MDRKYKPSEQSYGDRSSTFSAYLLHSAKNEQILPYDNNNNNNNPTNKAETTTTKTKTNKQSTNQTNNQQNP